MFRRSEKSMVNSKPAQVLEKPAKDAARIDTGGLDGDGLGETAPVDGTSALGGLAEPPPPHPSSDVNMSSPRLPSKKSNSNYGAYLKRKATGPSAPGSKKVPEGKEGCLEGLSFVFTGELSSISRDSASDLVKGCGGRVTSAPSRKTSYVVMGEMAGESKMAKVKELQLSVLDEDGLFDLVRSRASCIPDGKDEDSPPVATKISPKKTKKIRLDELDSQTDDTGNTLWTIKYAPRSSAELIGNHSVYERLLAWLGQESRDPKAALLSGPPGIGKTTMAHLAAADCKLKVLEFNASDCRNKKALCDSVKEVLNNTFISTKSSFFSSRATSPSCLQGQVIIMDEVDGMSAGDRGGMAELVQLIKRTKIPIICCCNDRSSPKVRTLANYCLDLRLRRPDARQVNARIKEICTNEGLKLQPNVVEELVSSTHGDIRQLLNVLSTFSIGGATVLSYDESKQLYVSNSNSTTDNNTNAWYSFRSGKDVEDGPFDATYKLLGGQYHRLSMAQRIDSYFVDSSLIPLMIQENYLRAKAGAPRPALAHASPSYIQLASAAADAISAAEHIESLIRGSNQEWSLAPLHGFMSCVLPSYYVHGSITEQIVFPSWFGMNSKAGKSERLLRELSMHTFSVLGASGSDMRRYLYCERLLHEVTGRLTEEGVDAAIVFMDSTHLCREDIDSLVELCGAQDHWAKIPGATKSSFTRKYNSTPHRLPYAVGQVAARPIKIADMSPATDDGEDADAGSDGGDNQNDEASRAEDDISKDKMIKQKKSKIAAIKKG